MPWVSIECAGFAGEGTDVSVAKRVSSPISNLSSTTVV